MSLPVFLFVVLLVALPSPGGAQVSALSALWRDWTTLDAEWRAERSIFPADQVRNRVIREAIAAGRDPRALPPRIAPRPAGPTLAPGDSEVPR